MHKSLINTFNILAVTALLSISVLTIAATVVMPEIANNGITTLDGAISDIDTTITVDSVSALGLSGSTTDAYVTIIDNSTRGYDPLIIPETNEIARITGVSGNVLTVTRAQGGTTAKAFSDGDVVELRIVADNLQRLYDSLTDGTDSISVDDILAGGTVTATGNITGANLTGTNTGDQNAAGVSIADAGAIITGTDVEAALQENRTAIDLNTAKTSNATHTGEVTGSGALTLDKTAITNQSIVTAVGADYVLISDTGSAGNLARALVSDIAGGTGDLLADGTIPLTANWNVGAFDITADTFIGALTGNADTVTTNANLTGDVTSSGNATTIGAGSVDLAMLSATGTASSSTYLRGDNTWATVSGSGDVLADGTVPFTGNVTIDTNSWAGATPDTAADHLVIKENLSQVGLSILASTGGNAQIYFGDTSATSQGRIRYANSGDTMSFFTSGVSRFEVNSTDTNVFTNLTIDDVFTAGSASTVVTNADGTVNLESLEADGATTGDLLEWNGTDWVPTTRPDASHTWVVDSPAVGGIYGPRIDTARTIDRVQIWTDTGTVDLNVEIRTAPNTSGTNSMTSDLQATSSSVAQTTFADDTIAAGEYLYVDISAVASSPTVMGITVSYE